MKNFIVGFVSVGAFVGLLVGLFALHPGLIVLVFGGVALGILCWAIGTLLREYFPGLDKLWHQLTTDTQRLVLGPQESGHD